MALLALGAALGLIGMFTGRSWLVAAGIVVLAAGFALRFVGRPRD